MGKRPAIKLNMKTLKSKIKHQKHSKQIAEKSKQQTADDDEVPVMPLLKIKLPSASRPKRTLLNVLTGLSKSLPKIPSTEIPWIPKNDEVIETDFTEKELQEEANRKHVAKNVKLEEALDIVESKLVVKEVLKGLIKEAVEKQNRPKLKPITLKLNNLTTQKPTLINNIIKKPKSNFKVIRVSPSMNKKVTKRPASGLDVSDYKGKNRKNRRPKKLDKLIIRNMASLNKEPTSEEVCSSVLRGIVQNLPCFSKDNKNNTPAPVMLKIRKTQIPNAQMKNLFNNATTKNASENNKIVSNSKSTSIEEAKIKRQKLLKKQLGIDMVNQGGIDNRMIIGAVNNTNKRKAKLEARKALVVPTKRRKNNSDEEKKNDNSKLDGTDIDEEVVEN